MDNASRREYHADYYARTASRRRMLASHRRQCKRWSQWLLDELTRCHVLRHSYSVDSEAILNLHSEPMRKQLPHGRTNTNTADGRHNRHTDTRQVCGRVHPSRTGAADSARLPAACRAPQAEIRRPDSRGAQTEGLRTLPEHPGPGPDKSSAAARRAFCRFLGSCQHMVLVGQECITRCETPEVTPSRSAGHRGGIRQRQGDCAATRTPCHGVSRDHRPAPGRYPQHEVGRHQRHVTAHLPVEDRKASRDRDHAGPREGTGSLLAASERRSRGWRIRSDSTLRRSLHVRGISRSLANHNQSLLSTWRQALHVSRSEGFGRYEVPHSGDGYAATRAFEPRNDPEGVQKGC